jgi:hypothetical protein
MMTEDEKRRVLEETARNLADREALLRDTARRQAAQPNPDPMIAWRQAAAEADAREAQGRRELREGERRMAREAQRQARLDPAAWEQWFVDRLQRHLPQHLMPLAEAVATSTNAIVDQLNGQAAEREKLLRQYREEIRDLKLECAKLGNLVSELRTNHALGAAPDMLARSVN